MVFEKQVSLNVVRRIVAVLIVGIAMGVVHAAQCVYKVDSGVTDLTSSSAWTNGAVPGANDIRF